MGLKNALYEDEEEAETRTTLESAFEAQKEQDEIDARKNVELIKKAQQEEVRRQQLAAEAAER